MAKKPAAVRVPGDAPADTSAETTDLDVSNTQEAAPKGKAAPGEALTAADYAEMHSSEVDAKTLKRSVLCKDGWVVPDLPPQAPVRA